MGTSPPPRGPTRRSVDPSRPGRRGDIERDAGVSFIETLVAIVLLGTVVVAILTAVRTSVGASSVAFESAQVETVLLNAVDRVERANQVLCDYEAYVDAAVPEDWSAGSVSSSVQKLVGHTGDPALDWSTCVTANGADDVVRVTITATSPDHGITRTITVVKSDAG